MINNKKAAIIGINLLVGVIFTILLFSFSTKLYANTFHPPGPEKDIVESWVKDIKEIDNGRATQLLYIPENLEDIVFGFFDHQTNTITINIDGTDYTLTKKGEGAAICSFNLETNTRYCKNGEFNTLQYRAKGSSISFNRNQIIVVPSQFFSKKYKIVNNYIIANQITILKKTGTLTVCDDFDTCKKIQ